MIKQILRRRRQKRKTNVRRIWADLVALKMEEGSHKPREAGSF